jgi:hypothetical protein
MGVQYTLFLLAHLAAVAVGVYVIRSLPQRVASTTWKLAIVLALSAVVAALAFVISDPHGIYRFRDIDRAYYAAGLAVLDSPGALTQVLGDGVSGFVNLPIVAYLFAPFALFDAGTAVVIFSALGLAAVVWAWLLLVRVAGLDRNAGWLLLFLFAANGPLIYSFKLGNTSHIILLALVGGLLLLRARRDVAAGALLGFAALIKLPLLVFGVYFVLRRYWTAAAAFSVVCGAAGLLSLAIFGWEMHQRWLELCVLQFSASPIGAWNVQSIPAFLDRLVHSPDVLLSWVPEPAGTLRRLLGTGLIGLMFAAAIYACARGAAPFANEGRRDSQAAEMEYFIVVALAVVASPLSWTHYYAWLLVPTAFFLSARWPQVSVMEQSMAWLAIFLVTPIAVRIPFANEPLLSLYAKAGVSVVLIGGLLWFALLVRTRAKLGSEALAYSSSTPVAARAGTQL